MSVFALNLRFDLESSKKPPLLVQTKQDHRISRVKTGRHKFRSKKVQAILQEQQEKDKKLQK